MRNGSLGPSRRLLLAAAAAASLPRAPAGATPPEAATLLVPGPDDGPLALWAQRIGAALGRHLPHAAALRVQVLGAADGLVAANRFATSAAPDGRSLLAAAPVALHARMLGDNRVRFDPSGWLPVCGAAMPVLLAGRTRPPRPGVALRLGLAGPDAPEAAALMALDGLGFSVTPVFGITAALAEAALAQGAVDAAVLAGPGLGARLAAIGAQPWLLAEPVPGLRDGMPAEVPMLAEALGPERAAITGACRPGFAVVGTRALVVLPPLTPADILAGWRQAGQRWSEEEARIPGDAARPLDAMDGAALLAALCPRPEAARLYREWLARRLSWRAA